MKRLERKHSKHNDDGVEGNVQRTEPWQSLGGGLQQIHTQNGVDGSPRVVLVLGGGRSALTELPEGLKHDTGAVK